MLVSFRNGFEKWLVSLRNGSEKWLVSLRNGFEKWLVSLRDKAKHGKNSVTETDLPFLKSTLDGHPCDTLETPLRHP